MHAALGLHMGHGCPTASLCSGAQDAAEGAAENGGRGWRKWSLTWLIVRLNALKGLSVIGADVR
eukprot:scaffold151032_cov26-Tisochrysis_lutea.AAC.1